MTRVAVVGAGTMGLGIAQAAAIAGFETTLTDANAAALARALDRVRDALAGGVRRDKLTDADAAAALRRVHTTGHLGAAADGAELVIEAIPEDLEAKRALFAELDTVVRRSCVLATNTSSLSIGRIADGARHPTRVLGMHFFNPVHAMQLVEIVVHERTAETAVVFVRDVAARMGKETIVVRDRPGFASSRLGVALGLEAMRMVEEGVASAEDIDKAMELGYGHPMGPLRVSDLVGLDVRLAVAEYLQGALQDARFAPPAILRQKVDAGELGKKSGRGFHQWPNTSS
jgi:3-hydroxybutyryl-CoA dehydrogenase